MSLLRYTAVAVIVVLLPYAAAAESPTVLVFPFENQTSDRTLDWIGEGIAEVIVGRLQTEKGIDVFTRDERVAAYEKLHIPEIAQISRATALKIGWDQGADHIVMGSFSGTPGDFQITARLVDMDATSATTLVGGGKLDDVISLSTALGWQILRKIVPGTESPESDYTARPPTPRSAFENYIRALLFTDFQKRADLLQTAVRLHPQYDQALFQLGRTSHLQGDFTASNQWLQKIPGDAPERPQILFLMGLNYFYSNDLTRAVAVYQQLPQTYDVLLNLGAAFLRKGDETSAMSAWNRAAILDPLSSDAFFNMGYALYLKGDWEAAEARLTSSLRLRGRDSEALFLLGRVYEKQGRAQESRRLINQATRLSTRVERWLSQPLPKLERFMMSTTFRTHDDHWTDRRLVRRARSQDLPAWLDVVQADIDASLFGSARRELQDLMKVFPESGEAKSLLNVIELRSFR
jgi:tetratricopeptide (TPR) repeat protein